MISSDELLEHLKKMSNEEDLSIGGNQYTLSQVKLAEKIVQDLELELKLASKKPKLSRRRAFIVILEELYYDVSEYPRELTLENIHKRASIRFEFVYRGLKNFETPMDIHPKNPCLFYESDTYRKARYRSALSLLVEFSETYFEIEEAAISLERTYQDILLC